MQYNCHQAVQHLGFQSGSAQGPIENSVMPADPSLHCWVLSMASKTTGGTLIMLCRSSDLPTQKYPDLCCAHAIFLIILRPTQTFGAQIFWSTTVVVGELVITWLWPGWGKKVVEGKPCRLMWVFIDKCLIRQIFLCSATRQGGGGPGWPWLDESAVGTHCWQRIVLALSLLCALI